MDKQEMVEMLAEAFETGTYSMMEVEQLHTLFEGLSIQQFKDISGKMLFVNKYRGKLPSLNQWRELWRDSKDEYFQPRTYSTAADDCTRCHQGFVYLYQQRAFRGDKGYVLLRCVARCTCAAGGRVGGMVPEIDRIENRGSFDSLVGNPADSTAYVWPSVPAKEKKE